LKEFTGKIVSICKPAVEWRDKNQEGPKNAENTVTLKRVLSLCADFAFAVILIMKSDS